jgi:RHH-type rel operon transcriptional repressor/antitoxin RelB
MAGGAVSARPSPWPFSTPATRRKSNGWFGPGCWIGYSPSKPGETHLTAKTSEPAREAHPMITITLPEQTEQHFAELARKAGKTTADLALEALVEKMEDLEDYFEAEEILRNSKPEDFIKLEDLEKELGLDG